MRKLIAIVALVCGAAGADAAEPTKWCSRSGPSEISLTNDAITITVDGKPVEVWDEETDLLSGELTIWLEGDRMPPERVLIFRDRIFRPGEAK
jgi:hypothetical protein